MGIESLKNSPNIEKKQTPEEIRSVLEKALNEGLHVDLVIDNLAGEPVLTPDLIVEEIEGNDLRMTYIAEDGDIGESIPLEMSRIKKAVLGLKVQLQKR